MTYEKLRAQASPAMREIIKMGPWETLHVDVQDGEPIIFAIIYKRPLQKFLLNVGLMKMPELPERVKGIRCKVLVRLHGKKQAR